jgi:undecaprenyl-diphosphatase
MMLVAPGSAILLSNLLQFLFNRPRPLSERLIPPTASYPSGHAMLSVVTYGLICYCLWRYLIRRPRPRLVLLIGTALLILSTGLSRIYLQVHYPSDVLVGWLAGGLLLSGVIHILNSEASSR